MMIRNKIIELLKQRPYEVDELQRIIYGESESIRLTECYRHRLVKNISRIRARYSGETVLSYDRASKTFSLMEKTP